MPGKILGKSVLRRRVAAWLMALGVSAQGIAAGDSLCDQLGLDGAASRLCGAYLFSSQCTDQPRETSCEDIAVQFRREAGYSIERVAAFQGVEQTVSASGGQVILPSVATVSFSPGDLVTDTRVIIRLTTEEPFRQFALDAQAEIGGGYEPLRFELRVSLLGSVPHGEDVPVTLSMRQEVWGLDTETEEFLVLVAQPQGSDEDPVTSSLVVADRADVVDSGRVSFNVPANAFFQDRALTLLGEEVIIYILKRGR